MAFQLDVVSVCASMKNVTLPSYFFLFQPVDKPFIDDRKAAAIIPLSEFEPVVSNLDN